MTSTTTDRINLTINVSQATKQWIAEQSERFDMPSDQVVEQLVDEAVRMRRFPRIGFREEGPRRRACIRGTRFDVWYIILGLREMGRERILNESSLSSYDLDATEGYYQCYSDEIDREIDERLASLEDLAKNYREYGIELIEF